MDLYLGSSLILLIVAIWINTKRGCSQGCAFLESFFLFFYGLFSIVYLVSDYFTHSGITPAVLNTLESGLVGAGFYEYRYLILIVFFGAIAFFCFLYFRYKKLISREIKRDSTINYFSILLLAFSIFMHPATIDVYEIYKKFHMKNSHDFYKYYKTPNRKVERPSMNLVFIYAESLEQTYFDKKIFPGLMEHLSGLQKDAIRFTEIHQVASTGWTIAGMVASQCGIPLFTTSQGNSMRGSDEFLEDAVCLGDVLKSSGYHLTFMQGASLSFSGKGNFYKTHSFDEVYGLDELMKKEQDYRNGWGLYDDTVLGKVYDKFEELSKRGKPFGLFLLTLDTHHPRGMTSKSCENIPYGNGENPILNAVHCSDKLLYEFINKIRNSNYSKNTIIVLVSDHLAMGNTASGYLAKGKRRDLFLVFDPRQEGVEIGRPGTTLDTGATILGFLGIEEDIGLGRNLLTKATLYETIKDLNQKLWSWRNDILELWNFPKVSDKIKIVPREKKVYFGHKLYSYPLLVKIENDKMIPYFDFDDPITYSLPTTLIGYLDTFLPTDRFIWIDKCEKVDLLFHDSSAPRKEGYCLAEGSLVGNIRLIHLNDRSADYDINSKRDDSEKSLSLYFERKKTIKRLLQNKRVNR